MKTLLISAVEGIGLGTTINFAAQGYHWPAVIVGWATILFAYADGQNGWSE